MRLAAWSDCIVASGFRVIQTSLYPPIDLPAAGPVIVECHHLVVDADARQKIKRKGPRPDHNLLAAAAVMHALMHGHGIYSVFLDVLAHASDHRS